MTIARFSPEQREALKAKIEEQKRMAEEENSSGTVTKVTQVKIGQKVEMDLKSKTVQAFVESAPDGTKKNPLTDGKKRTDDGKWQLRGRKVIITLGIKPDQLRALDEMAQEEGRTRSELLNLIIRKALLKGRRDESAFW